MRRKVSLLGLLWLPYKVATPTLPSSLKVPATTLPSSLKVPATTRGSSLKVPATTRASSPAGRIESRGAWFGAPPRLCVMMIEEKERRGEGDRGGRRGRKGKREKLPAGGGPMLRPSPPPAPPSPTPHVGWQSSGGWGGIPACVRRRRRCSLRSDKRLRRHPVAARGVDSRGVHTSCPRGARVVLAFPAAALARVRLHRACARYHARVL